jgi:hypothetical protein
MAVEILLCWGSAQEIVMNSGTTRVVRKRSTAPKKKHELHELARMQSFELPFVARASFP